MFQDKITLRKATEEDCDLLFYWRNEKECRENSINTEEVPYETHCAWFGRRMNDADTLIFIGQSSDKCIGMVRVDIEGNVGNISYSIDKDFRGRGFGKKILQALEENAEVKKRIVLLQAQVKYTNVASGKIFLDLGYEEENLAGFYYYKKIMQ